MSFIQLQARELAAMGILAEASGNSIAEAC